MVKLRPKVLKNILLRKGKNKHLDNFNFIFKTLGLTKKD